LCTAVVSLAGNLFLYYYLSNIINEKARNVNAIYLDTLSARLEEFLLALEDLGILCANDSVVSGALAGRVNPVAANRAMLSAQTRLNLYIAGSSLNEFVETLVAFHVSGRMIVGSGLTYGLQNDTETIMNSALYAEMKSRDSYPIYLMAIAPSIRSRSNVLALLCPVRGLGSTPGTSYIYIELGGELFERELSPYIPANDIVVADNDGRFLTTPPESFPENFDVTTLKDGRETIGEKKYQVDIAALSAGGLRLYYCVPDASPDNEGLHLIFVVACVVLLSLLLGLLLAVLVSTYLSRPIQYLNQRLKRAAENDFSYDPRLEEPSGELGQIGRTVNEMMAAIQNLLKETTQMYEQRRNIEIELLQSQVNPHFLYNTLDSIRWMAVIQKNSGIESMTRSLSSLLRSIAKGTQDKIPLEEELHLLQDYVAIQTVRYMETFTYENRVPKKFYRYRIVKLTLQPLLENAIFHGIEPTGKCGTIIVDCREEENDLLLSVEDDGAGIPPEKLETILSSDHTRGRSSLNGIGIANVNKRLQLIYGSSYGLQVESEPGCFTRILVRIPKENDETYIKE